MNPESDTDCTEPLDALGILVGIKTSNSSLPKRASVCNMSVFNRILKEIPNETELYTPVQKKPFKVLVDAEKEIVHLLARKTIIFIPREDWNGIPDYLNGEGIGDGWFPIGTKHGKAKEGTLQWHSDQFFSLDKTHSADACYLASVLKHLDIVEINPNKPSRVRLKKKR